MLMRYACQMKEHIHALQQRLVGIAQSQIQSQRRLPTGKRITAPTQRNNGMAACNKFLAKLATDKSGSAADETFHCTKSPI